MRDLYDVIVIGGGHAGTEAAWAAANALGMKASGHQGIEASRGAHNRDAPGCLARSVPGGLAARVALITMDPSRIGAMSCNPAIGGLAKGQIVREIDAMGGLMGLAADATGIQFRVLNMSRGAAVRGPRAQCDKYAYAAEVQRLIAGHPWIDVIAATVDELVVEDGRAVGVIVPEGARVVAPDPDAIQWNLANRGLARPVFERGEHSARGGRVFLRACAVVLTTGTFMRALMHTGENRSAGGRLGEGSAVGISACLRSLGFELGRLKTGTPPRLDAESIAWAEVDPQPGDESPAPFSDRSPAAMPAGRFPHLPQVRCFATETTSEAHDVIRANIHRAPMYSGAIEADCGPRYCPSIEDKVVRFADRSSHHVFLEPESLHTNEVYCNGISTSLPADVQEMIVRSMRGCAGARVLKWGYAVEYDMVWPHQIDSTGMTRRIGGLFLAGQINGTSGYEEAAGQGLVAGVNAARFARSVEPVVIRRDQAYLGVMMDDLVTKTPREPYRMFTSRAEHRILLRADNADERLTPLARDLGLIGDDHWQAFTDRQRILRETRDRIAGIRIDGKRGDEYVRRPEVTLDVVARLLNGAAPPRSILARAMHDIQYEAYLDRQRAEVRRLERAEQHRIPVDLDYWIIPGLRAETREALARFRPATLGQASRIAGVNPTDLTILAVAIRRHGTQGAVERAAPPG